MDPHGGERGVRVTVHNGEEIVELLESIRRGL